jgi:predicted nucleotidyltransferase component of viral defense system
MRLHENQQLFNDAILAASRTKEEGGLGIKSIFIEKDYWICRSLSLMAGNDKEGRAIFKGGTSLTKAYGIGARFSEDIDIAIS